MRDIIQDLDRPDVGGTPPKMAAIAEKATQELAAPFLKIEASDNICSSVSIHGAFQQKEEWPNRIFHNAPYFIFSIAPAGRYYEEGQKVTVELLTKGRNVNKFRKYTSTPEKVIAKIKAWIQEQTQ